MLTASKYGMAQSPPVSPHEEDLSLVLGTMQVARGRSYSTTNTPKVPIPEATNNSIASSGSPHPKKTELLVRSSSSVGEGSISTSGQPRSRKKSAPSGRRDSTSSNNAEDFFIDTILQRHACRLLADKRLRDLGRFASHLDFHLVAWLKTERYQAARIDDCVDALRFLHRDFNWPYPAGCMNFQVIYLISKIGLNLFVTVFNGCIALFVIIPYMDSLRNIIFGPVNKIHGKHKC
jgi:RAB6A-GEF complex partner protein 1